MKQKKRVKITINNYERQIAEQIKEKVMLFGIIVALVHIIVYSFIYHDQVEKGVWAVRVKAKVILSVSMSAYEYLIDIEKVLNQYLSNREIALLLWSVTALIWIFSKSDLRKTVLDLFKVVFQKKLVVLYVLCIAYIIAQLTTIHRYNLWSLNQLKDTVIWFLFSGFILLMDSTKAKVFTYFKNIIMGQFKVVVLFEFIVNMYQFNLIIELLIIPVSFILFGLQGLLENYRDFQGADAKLIKKIVDALITVFGLGIIGKTAYELVNNWGSAFSSSMLKTLSLAPLLTLPFMIFIYMFSVYSSYELFFTRLGFKKIQNQRSCCI